MISNHDVHSLRNGASTMPKIFLEFDSKRTFKKLKRKQLDRISLPLREITATGLSTEKDKIPVENVEVRADYSRYTQNADQLSANIYFSPDEEDFKPTPEQIIATATLVTRYLSKSKVLKKKGIIKVSCWPQPSPGGVYK